MKRRIGIIGLGLISGWLFTCCEPDPVTSGQPNLPPDTLSQTAKVYVLCEGLYGMDNTSLFCWNVRSGAVQKDVFRSANARGMGDTGNDLEIYGGKMYAAMNGSNLIEVMDARTAGSLKQIPMLNARGVGRQPRYICAYGGKVYVSCFDNTVCRIDTATLEVEAVVKVGRNPDGLCVSNGKLYVCNSGGLDYPNYDNTVSVVDLASFTEIKRITVGHNPYTASTDTRGNVYISTRGNYDGFTQNGDSHSDASLDKEGYNFYRIDPVTDSVVRVYDLPVLSFCISGDTAYIYNYNYATKNSSVQVLDLLCDKICNDDFVGSAVNADGMSAGVSLQTPYAIAADPHTGYIYIGEAYNYMRSGCVYTFKPDGELLYTFASVGLNPSSFAFLP